MSGQYLKVKGANIYYEVKGEGPCIVFMAGGDGGHKPFKPLRELLVKHFTVVLYNRRGYYKSKLTEPQDYTKRIETDVEDLYKVMKNVTDKTFSIFSSSSSGIVALTYINTYPKTVHKCFLHEPMIDLSALPNGKQAQEDHRKGMEIFVNDGREAALAYYGDLYFNKLDRYYMVDKQIGQVDYGWHYHLRYESGQYLFTRVDIKTVKAYRDKLLLIHGIKSMEDFVHLPVAAFSKALNKDLISFPGGHIGFYTEYEKFAVELIKVYNDSCLINQSKL
ncbi:Alpha/Beta hydrolase protein [Thamnidium elegans]|uniref:AB hydrolase-1 domain-containing protein n=1 Tax=Thamnidium elegans TaxID=101142 RepID=A0A8H7W0C9_9FUNG|nr:hypothetical protein INT48_005275 [Thamnidium elegans]KAI8079348.1 Alpha/Beta hydrolase protein [Thamnidium elegans]